MRIGRLLDETITYFAVSLEIDLVWWELACDGRSCLMRSPFTLPDEYGWYMILEGWCGYTRWTLVLIIWGLDSTMFETVVVGWVAVISVSHIRCYYPYWHSPLLALWASHEHHSLLFLIALLTFYTGIGALQCMHAWFRSFMSLGPRGASFSLSFPIIASLHFITLHRLRPLSYLLLVLHHFLHPEWWSPSIHYMESGHVISIIYLTDVDPGILGLRGSHH